MKILYIYGDDDYAALDFDKEIGIEKARELWEKGQPLPLPEGVYYKVQDFGDVDPKFIDFIRDKIQDYEDSKHSNFYTI